MPDKQDDFSARSDAAPASPPAKPQPKRLTWRWRWWIGGLIGLVVGGIPAIRQIHDANRSSDPEAQAVQIEQQVLSKNPSLVLVQRREPGLVAEQHRKLVALLRQHPEGLGAPEILEWEKPEDDRIKRGAASASDATVAAIYKAKLALLEKLQAVGPEACKSYVALDLKGLTSLPENLKQEVRAADQPLYEAYEEGVGKPLPAVPTEAQADASLARMQGPAGIQISQKDVGLLDGTGPATEVCDAMIRFMKVLAHSPAVVSAPVIRFMLMQ